MKLDVKFEADQVASGELGNGPVALAIPETPEATRKRGEDFYSWRVRVALEAAYKLATYGLACFPCLDEDRPACPGGVKQATSDLCSLAKLWKNYPGDLVGVATGAASGIDILRIDARHGLWWWHMHRYDVPLTHMHWRLGGGFNYAFRHQPGLPSLNGCPVPGCDIRADNDYVVWWPADGLPYVHAAPARWPNWLLRFMVNACRFVGPDWDEGLQTARLQAMERMKYAMEHIGTATAAERDGLLLMHSQRLFRLVPEVLSGEEVFQAMVAAATQAELDYDDAVAILAQ